MSADFVRLGAGAVPRPLPPLGIAVRWLATLRASRLWIVGLALVLAFVASTLFLAQPFVWRHWGVDEVLVAWLGILGERVLVALTIAASVLLALAAFDRLPALPAVARAALYTLAIAAAATAAEALLRALDTADAATTPIDFTEHVLRWICAALAVTGLRLARLRAIDADAASSRARREALEAQAQLATLRLQRLQAQIEPHFLFNTLATVRRLGATDPAHCAELLAHLVDFIALSQAAQPGTRRWRVADELALVRSYLGVVELRMDGRLHVAFDADPAALQRAAPPLALATLVENAVKHGISPAPDGGEIRVAVREAGGRVQMSVADTGVGLRSGGGSGIGLSNTRARLRSLHGDEARLDLAANRPSGVVATLHWPADREDAR